MRRGQATAGGAALVVDERQRMCLKRGVQQEWRCERRIKGVCGRARVAVLRLLQHTHLLRQDADLLVAGCKLRGAG